MSSKTGHFQILFDSQKQAGEGMETTYLFMFCSASLLQWVGSDQHHSLCQAPGAGKKGKGHGTALLSVEPCTGNATTTCPLLEAVWLLVLPLKFSNFTLSSSWAVMLLLSPRNSENYYIFINHVKFSNSPSCTQSSLENNNHFHFLGWVQFVTAA